MKNIEKWPTYVKITKVSDNILSKVLTIYLIVAVANKNQVDTISEWVDLHAKYEVENNKFVIASLVSQDILEQVYRNCKSLSKSWRGQYQALTKEFVKAYDEVLDVISKET